MIHAYIENNIISLPPFLTPLGGLWDSLSGIELMPPTPAVEVQSLTYWTTRGSPNIVKINLDSYTHSVSEV